ncbi:unnamed protein product [Brassica rapa subsp. narinosa]
MSFETLSPPLRSSFLVLSEALSLPEPPDPPDASCRSLFFCTLTHHSLWFVSTLQSQLVLM